VGDIRMITTRKDGGWSETGVYVGNTLHAVVTHPCAGARWFLHTTNFKTRRYSTQKAALAAATKELEEHNDA